MEIKKKSIGTQICHLSIPSSPFPFFLSYIQLLDLSEKHEPDILLQILKPLNSLQRSELF